MQYCISETLNQKFSPIKPRTCSARLGLPNFNFSPPPPPPPQPKRASNGPEALSIFHFKRAIFYTVNLIVNDLFVINFVYTLCSSTPGQIQYGRFTRALARKICDMIRDQVRILHLISMVLLVTPCFVKESRVKI